MQPAAMAFDLCAIGRELAIVADPDLYQPRAGPCLRFNTHATMRLTPVLDPVQDQFIEHQSDGYGFVLGNDKSGQ